MKKHFSLITALLFVAGSIYSQWSLKLTSNVYLRTWKLDTKASKEEKEVDGATITLFQNGKQISQTTSSNGGEFTVMVPKDGEYYLVVSYPGCNAKRMAVNTQNVPESMSKDNYKPSFEITGGFIMVKPYPGIDYSQLSKDLIRVEYTPGKKAFDDTDAGTEQGLGIVSKIYAAEDDLFNKFCSTNKAGDVALAKPDCPLAKMLYEKAIAMIPGEQYPVVQLAKVGLCLKDKELAEKKSAEEAAAKLAAANAKKEDADKKAIADAIAKANEEKAKQIKEEEEKLAKANKEKAAKEEAENAKIAKQKATEEKKSAAANQPTTQTTSSPQTPKEKKGDIKIKQKSPEQIEKEAEEAKKREGLAKSQAEDREAIAKDAAEAKAKYDEKQKAAREKEQKQKEGLAKSKAEDEAAMKEKEAKKAAKQKEHEEKQKEGMAKSKAEDDAAIKADAEKKAKKQAEREAEEKEKKRLAYETKSKDGQGEMDKGNSDHSIPQVIGAAEKYRERIKAADELFKRKRYDEAKDIYNEALTYKEKDAYALSKLAEIEKLKAPK